MSLSMVALMIGAASCGGNKANTADSDSVVTVETVDDSAVVDTAVVADTAVVEEEAAAPVALSLIHI